MKLRNVSVRLSGDYLVNPNGQEAWSNVETIARLAEDVPLTAHKRDWEEEHRHYWRCIDVYNSTIKPKSNQSLVCKVTDRRGGLPFEGSNQHLREDKPFCGVKQYVFEDDALRPLSREEERHICFKDWNPP